ncbi:glucose-6-phosphate isomerase [Mycoavidus cysteinexigens]|uniref:Glucose-6-phosphate isomerase n=1 Tax=Mycoavidus cysteinexigens TaxID=1553431 RepID=A0A2Z6EVH9_9BURK|nr:glucose-6-phosphate isomerase [Mycoavidus cysteinexigens]BBE09418.1 glucose-6-phosphate isomerase [Mycoavidus cysteinexigens]GAM51825.1 glucose-6-phosphate isomerase [bacterium endosymbiont of Mortierella elongata FMR23-6]GLR01637.1 glucose-6-phosphate isomerase [Mycoavidus cysteinexigens]
MPLKSLAAWTALDAHYAAIGTEHMRDWFAAANDLHPTRAQRFTLESCGITLDFSKNRITDQTLQLLMQLAHEACVPAARDAMFAGEIVNPTEARAALHTALRAQNPPAPYAAQIKHEWNRMVDFANQVREQQWRGHTGKPIQSIVNIGIGGSDLGPKMLCHALAPLGDPRLSMHFVSNVDGADLQRVLSQLDPATTLAVIVSKTFTTLETMTNAESLRHWLLNHGVPEAKLGQHLVGVTADPAKAVQFGILPEQVFKIWDWVGGRYSLWSAVGLSALLYLGPTHFAKLLAGAAQMDQHFREAPLIRNLPIILALLGIWYRNFFGAPSYSIAPYAAALRYFPAYLQQLEMESNGKSVCLDGSFADYETVPIVWGETGTNGQHAFFQMLHQGSTMVPVDFILPLTPEHELAHHHPKLLANCFAQSQALMLGRTLEATQQRVGPDQQAICPHLTFAGNRPSNTIMLDALTPHTLGALIAVYEHKTLVQATIWNINPFDQWGVELGKQLSAVIENDLVTQTVNQAHDSSTRALIAHALRVTHL